MNFLTEDTGLRWYDFVS